MNQSMQSVAKRSPQSHPIHVTPHLSTIEEGGVEMAEQNAGCELYDTATGSHTDMAASSRPDLAPRLPLPEDLQHAEAFQVCCAQCQWPLHIMAMHHENAGQWSPAALHNMMSQ